MKPAPTVGFCVTSGKARRDQDYPHSFDELRTGSILSQDGRGREEGEGLRVNRQRHFPARPFVLRQAQDDLRVSGGLGGREKVGGGSWSDAWVEERVAREPPLRGIKEGEGWCVVEGGWC